MTHRPHGGKHTLALWMLVGLADAVLVVTSAGAMANLLLALAVAVLAGVVVTLRLVHRSAVERRATVTQGRRSWQQARAETEGRGWLHSRA